MCYLQILIRFLDVVVLSVPNRLEISYAPHFLRGFTVSVDHRRRLLLIGFLLMFEDAVWGCCCRREFLS